MERLNDAARLCGVLAGRPVFSHACREGIYYKFPLSVKRLSGTDDTLNIVAPLELLRSVEAEEKPRILVRGEVRSFNNRSGDGPKLVITVLARTAELTDAGFENKVALSGAVCRPPTLRRTPMGREICDLMLAVRRRCGRSDYIPCIAWGRLAETAADLPVGTELAVAGRLQSRVYVKNEDDVPVEKTAFEVSAVELSRAEA